jgi:hypothetical protein
MNREGLWDRSAAWRWILVLTCLATATVGLLGPWHMKTTVLPNVASYQQAGQAPLPTTPTQNASAAAISQTKNGHDETFDVVASPAAVGFPPGTELHIVGAYEGALPNGQKEQPWWAKCGADTSNPTAMIACHQQYAGQHTEKTITVTVSRSSTPKVLALLAYEPVKWKIVGADSSNVLKIIVGGYHGQDVEGVGAETPVEVYSYESSPCRICSRQSGHFYAYQKDTPEYAQTIDKLKTLTGLSPTSFQGAQRSERFAISGTSQVVPAGNRSNIAKHQSDPILGHSFVDEVSIANMAVPLPEGKWQGLVYAENPSTRGSDELAVLARIEQDKLIELIVLRAQFASDGRGFSRHTACETLDTHASRIEANQDFGTQMCFWVSHDTAPWVQPIFNLAANRLTAKNIALPGFFVNSVFHKADKSSALTVVYSTNPEAKGISTPKTAWDASPWHPKYLNQFSDKAPFMQDRVQWSNTWFQLFKATH